MEFDDVDFMQPSLVPLSEATHEGSDVGVYAVGVNAHLFTGVYEQHYIAHAMMYATCLGPDNFQKVSACNSASATFPRFFLLFHVIFMVMLSVK
jgi:alkaline phosphatase